VTISVLWYRKLENELWCVADSRITNNSDSVITDSGPKILPIPIVCHKNSKKTKYKRTFSYTFGFSFSGSTLAAINAHSLASACTQNLASISKSSQKVSVKTVAELYRKISEQYIKDMSFSQINSNIKQYFFEAFIFGFCPRQRVYKAFQIYPLMTGNSFEMVLADAELYSDRYYPIGSGTEDFKALFNELERNDTDHIITTLQEMLNTAKRRDVGGHFQLGVANKIDFNLMPVLSREYESEKDNVSFLGWDVDTAGDLDEYRIGFQAFSPATLKKSS